jgi:predicted RNase H-like HicB family nuclease
MMAPFVRSGSPPSVIPMYFDAARHFGDSIGLYVGGKPFRFRVLLEREGDGYVALCPELDVASQGDTVEQARANLKEALELFFETADSSEIARRMGSEVFVTQVEIAVG